MAAKRKYDLGIDDGPHTYGKKHSLDSDEDDSDDYEREDAKDFDVEGEEDGSSNIRDNVKITPFNMHEELQEGHFDKEGHYHWDKSNDTRDNWLDNIDCVKIDERKKKEIEGMKEDTTTTASITYTYRELLGFMNRNETVSESLCHLGKSTIKMSTVERIKKKKLGIIDDNAEKIIKFTELVSSILTTTGNVDLYQMTYEAIEDLIKVAPSTSKPSEDTDKEQPNSKQLLWEFKWNQEDLDLQGPYSTRQMLELVNRGQFKKGVYVRKFGENTKFYTSNRIDFDLYL